MQDIFRSYSTTISNLKDIFFKRVALTYYILLLKKKKKVPQPKYIPN